MSVADTLREFALLLVEDRRDEEAVISSPPTEFESKSCGCSLRGFGVGFG